MTLVLLTLLVCLLLSAAVALYVAYPARGRDLPGAGRSAPTSRGRAAAVEAGPSPVSGSTAEGSR